MVGRVAWAYLNELARRARRVRGRAVRGIRGRSPEGQGQGELPLF